MTTLIAEAISRTNFAPIAHSNLKGGAEIDQVKLNYFIAQAIMELNEITAFGKGTVDLPNTLDEGRGYVYRRGEFLMLTEFERNKGISKIVLGQELETDQDYVNFLQAIILLEMTEDTSNNDLRASIVQLLSYGNIIEGSDEASQLAKISMVFETMMNNGSFNPLEVEVDDLMDIIPPFENLKDVLGLNIVPAAPVLAPIEEAAQEKAIHETVEGQQELSLDVETTPAAVQVPTGKTDVYEVARQITAVKEKGVILQEISDACGVSISTLSQVQNLKNLNVREKTLLRISETLATFKVTDRKKEVEPQASIESAVEVATPVVETKAQTKTAPVAEVNLSVQTMKRTGYTLEEIKAQRPNIFNDDAVRAYLSNFTFETYKPFADQHAFIEAVITYRKAQREEHVPEHQMLKIEEKLRYVGDPKTIEMALKAMLSDVHVLFKGPAGAGKTVIAQTLSAILNMPLHTMNGSGDSDSDIIIGSKEAANGTTYAVDGRLVEAMKYAGIFYADETNFVLPDILAVINAALDHRKSIYNDNTGEDVIGHKNFRFIGSINEGYEGTRKMNEATSDRTISIIVDYMSPKHLEEYLRNFDPGYTDFQKNVLKLNVVSDADIVMLKNIATRLQGAVKRSENPLPQEIASIRNIEQILKLTRMNSFEAAIKTIIQKYDPDIRADIVGVLQGVDRLHLNPKEFLVG
jgi:MoxR-like ATPase/transcriptional regulator with XRE-family HTH domain